MIPFNSRSLYRHLYQRFVTKGGVTVNLISRDYDLGSTMADHGSAVGSRWSARITFFLDPRGLLSCFALAFGEGFGGLEE